MKQRFIFSFTLSAVWLIICLIFAQAWARDAAAVLGYPYTWFVIIGIALLPGFLMTAMFVSNLLHLQLPQYDNTSEDTTIVICARNEAKQIYAAVKSAAHQQYAGHIHVLVVDNGSVDATSAAVLKLMPLCSNRFQLTLLSCEQAGKHHALNLALRYITTRHFITLDADTVLHKHAVQRIMNQIVHTNAACVAGNLLVSGAQHNLISKIQSFDYHISIAAVKRFQGSYQSALVAQGAFSAYQTKAVRQVGGWNACFGEDIVLTYRLLAAGGISGYEPRAGAYTHVPNRIRHLYGQRRRWAYGMLEGLQAVRPWQHPRGYTRCFAHINLSVFYLDLAYLFGFLPACILALCGMPLLAGIYTIYALLAALPAMLSFYLFQKRLGLPFRSSLLGFLGFLTIFQAISSTAALHGYLLYLFHRTTMRWK